jgi:prephenate dehydrogenase
MPVQITIIGLGRTGTSFGLALTKIKDQIVRIGNDIEPTVMRQAEKLGAVDKTIVNLPSAVRDADVVILALPVDEIRKTMEVIAQDLKPGSVLMDTSPLKGRVMDWAKELLPTDDRYFVSLTPSLNPAYLMETLDGPEGAHADLFQNSLMLVTTMPGIDESAITLAINLITVLGAVPLFSDPAEADGLMAYSHLLPEIVSAALINATIDQPGWREARKMAGHAYAQATESAMHFEENKELGQAALHNSENLVRMLDHVLVELRQLRDAIAAGESEALKERLLHAQEGRDLWLRQRRAADWEPKGPQQHIPTGGEAIGRLFGIRPRKDKDNR